MIIFVRRQYHGKLIFQRPFVNRFFCFMHEGCISGFASGGDCPCLRVEVSLFLAGRPCSACHGETAEVWAPRLDPVWGYEAETHGGSPPSQIVLAEFRDKHRQGSMRVRRSAEEDGMIYLRKKNLRLLLVSSCGERSEDRQRGTGFSYDRQVSRERYSWSVCVDVSARIIVVAMWSYLPQTHVISKDSGYTILVQTCHPGNAFKLVILQFSPSNEPRLFKNFSYRPHRLPFSTSSF